MNAARDLAAEMGRATDLAEALRFAGLGDDETLIVDSIEGETDALEAVSRLLRWIGERDALSASLKVLEADYAARRRRFDEGVKGARQALAGFMTQVGVTKIERPEATLSLRTGGQSVGHAGDFCADALPDDMVKIERKPDLAAVKAALIAGRDVPGAYLTNAPMVLAIRVR